MVTELRLWPPAHRPREGKVAPVVRFVKESFLHKLFEYPLAGGRVQLPQVARLGDGESKSGHLAVFTSNSRATSDSKGSMQPRPGFPSGRRRS